MSGQNEIKKASFWISQLCIITATVLGVFLAASQGFEQAIQFDNIKGDKNNYYLRKSLQNELSDNVGYIRDFIGKVRGGVDKPELTLETFVWRSMVYSSAALETPSELLRETQKFYHKAEEIMSTPYYNNQNKANYLGELAEHMEKNVLPKFEKDTDDIRKSLQARSMDV